MKAEITIKEGNKRPVNPLIFGHFIEYERLYRRRHVGAAVKKQEF